MTTEHKPHMERPPTGTDAYTVWFWVQNMKHLRSYTEQRGVVTDPDLDEDLRELGYEAADAALGRLVEQLEAAEKALAFYGDPETYFAIGFLPDRPCGEFEDDFEELDGALGHPGGGSWVKPGKRARAYFRDSYPAERPES